MHATKPSCSIASPADALQRGVEIRDIDQRHDADTAGKLLVAQRLTTLSVTLNISDAKRLLLFIALGKYQQVRRQVKTGYLRSASG